MPPRLSKEKDSGKRKSEIAAKVKEIKDRQQRWMEEKRAFSGDVSGSKATPRKTPNSRSHLYHDDDSESLDSPTHSRTSDRGLLSYVPGNYETPPHSSSGDFNLIADRIIHRVKHDLAVDGGSGPEEAERIGSSPAALPAHLCQKCQQLMVSPHHSPMMLIPCGHNFCQACCRGVLSCYTCDIEVDGQTENIMLQQIILNKHSTGKTSKRTQRTKDEQQFGEQKEQLQTLLLRREAMEEEKSNIERAISEIKERITGEVEQISNIERKEAEIVSEISHLQGKLVKLQQHKLDFKEKIRSHQSDIDSERRKVELIDETVEYLSSRLSSLNHKT